MSTVADVITAIRVEINDSDSTRFTTDTPILAILKRAIRRANRICQINGLAFAKKFGTLTCTASQAYVNMPADFDVFLTLYRTDNRTEVVLKNEWQWEELSATLSTELQGCILDYANSRILLRGEPPSAIPLELWYFPTVDPSAYTTASTMPWGGRLDDALVEYVAMRMKNLDEYNVDVEKALLTDMESAIILADGPNQQTVVDDKGWLPE